MAGKLSKAKQILERLLPSGLKDAELIAAREAMGPEKTAEYFKALEDVAGTRAQRADEIMGKNPDHYHGSDVNFKEFKPSKGGASGPGIYTTIDPEIAARYAGDEGAQIYPLRVRYNKALGKNEDDLNKVVTAAGENPDYFVGRNDTISILNHIAQKDGPEKSAQLLKSAGFDAVTRGEKGMMQETILQSPEQVRSKFAAFDPRYKDSKYILAAGAPVAAMNTDSKSPTMAQIAAYARNPGVAAREIAAKMKQAWQAGQQRVEDDTNSLIDLHTRAITKAKPGTPEYEKARDDAKFQTEMSIEAGQSVGSIAKMAPKKYAEIMGRIAKDPKAAAAMQKLEAASAKGTLPSSTDSVVMNAVTGKNMPVVPTKSDPTAPLIVDKMIGSGSEAKVPQRKIPFKSGGNTGNSFGT
jgi:ADP-Ribosyltransferase in polyvalent proteins